MQRLRSWLPLAITTVLFALPLFFPPLLALAQSTAGHAGGGLVPCGAVSAGNPLGATQCGLCDFGQLIQNIINYLIVISFPISAALFAYAGILLFTASDNVGKRDQAKSIFKNVVIGLIIALSGYLVVQTVLNGLLNRNFLSGGLSWNQLQCASDASRDRTEQISTLFTGLNNSGTNGLAPAATGSTGSTQTGGSGGTTGGAAGVAQCSLTNTACGVPAIVDAAAAANIPITNTEANIMSCIAVTELGGSSVGCSGTGPCGTFQITQTNWNTYAPSGCTGLGNQNNAACNLQTALIMVQKVGYQPWTGSNANGPWNPNAQTCVNTYTPSS
jgi:hypothetical protein